MNSHPVWHNFDQSNETTVANMNLADKKKRKKTSYDIWFQAWFINQFLIFQIRPWNP